MLSSTLVRRATASARPPSKPKPKPKPKPKHITAHASDVNYKRHPDLAQTSATHIHLLRALLRQASYLPDPFIRQYFRKHILARYRAYPHGNDWQRPRHPHHVIVPADRRAHLAQEAKAALRRLRRANEGYYQPLTHVFLLAYGRTGKRRHELLRPVMRADAAYLRNDPIHTHMENLHPEHKVKIPVMPYAVIALLQSQAQQSARFPPPVPTVRARVRSLVPDLPKKNIWARPMPQKRQANKARAKHGELLDRALPPLPPDEFERLRRLAKSIEVPDNWYVRRRPLGTDMRPGPSDPFEISNIQIVTSAGQPGPIKRPWTPETRPGGKEQPHHITLRYVRRMWQAMFTASCRMDWDPKSSKWAFEWGSLPRGRACRPELRQAVQDLSSKWSSV